MDLCLNGPCEVPSGIWDVWPAFAAAGRLAGIRPTASALFIHWETGTGQEKQKGKRKEEKKKKKKKDEDKTKKKY